MNRKEEIEKLQKRFDILLKRMQLLTTYNCKFDDYVKSIRFATIVMKASLELASIRSKIIIGVPQFEKGGVMVTENPNFDTGEYIIPIKRTL